MRAHSEDAGLDLTCIEDVHLPVGGRQLVRTGVSVTLPSGTYGRVAPRSGRAFHYGVHVLAGIIDRQYSGEIKLLLINLGDKEVRFKVKDKVANFIVIFRSRSCIAAAVMM